MKKGLGPLLIAGSLALSGCIDNGGGQKVGIITRVNVHKVLGFCATNEGEIVRGGLNAGTGIQGAPFDFTIEDPKLIPVVQEAMEKGTEVEITYKTESMTWCRSASGSGNHFITEIKPAKRPSGNVTAKIDEPVGIYKTEKPKDTVGDKKEIVELLQIQQQLIQRLIEKGDK